MKRLAIIGAGDLGQLIGRHSQALNCSVAGFFDDFQTPGTITRTGTVLGPIEALLDHYRAGHFDQFIVAIGYRHLKFREQCFQRWAQEIPAATLIHPSCYIDPSALVEPGCFLLPGCVLDAGVKISANSVLNTGVSIAHDSQVKDCSFLGPGVCLAGFVEVGRRCFLGIRTTVIDSISIADDVQTGGGSVVVRNLDQAGLYMGVPARLRPLTREP